MWRIEEFIRGRVKVCVGKSKRWNPILHNSIMDQSCTAHSVHVSPAVSADVGWKEPTAWLCRELENGVRWNISQLFRLSLTNLTKMHERGQELIFTTITFLSEWQGNETPAVVSNHQTLGLPARQGSSEVTLLTPHGSVYRKHIASKQQRQLQSKSHRCK